MKAYEFLNIVDIYQHEISIKYIFFPINIQQNKQMCQYWQLSLWVVVVPCTNMIQLVITKMCVLLLRAVERRKVRKSVNFMHKLSQNDVPLGSPDLVFLSLAIFCQTELMNCCQTHLMFLIMCEGFSSFNELCLQ